MSFKLGYAQITHFISRNCKLTPEATVDFKLFFRKLFLGDCRMRNLLS